MSELLMGQNELLVLQQQIRIVLLVDAAIAAGISPVPVNQLHLLAYYSNVLSPVWELLPLDGKILKRHGGPFYPSLQRQVDHLVGLGVLSIHGVDHAMDEDGKWRLVGSYSPNAAFADRILAAVSSIREMHSTRTFIQELAYALASLDIAEVLRTADEDAAYSDPVVEAGNVVDFGEWRDVNYSSRSADYMASLMPSGNWTTPGEKIHMYVRHIHQRLRSAR
jgi:hypothetical protein